MNVQSEFQRYIKQVTGTVPVIKSAPDQQVGKLPLYLRSYYHIAKTRLFCRQVLLAFQNVDADAATPAEYASQHGMLCSTLNEDIVLVLPQITAYCRRHLVRLGIPFVVPNRQIFLPPTMVDLRERFPRTIRQPAERLSSAAQVVLLHHLVGKPTEGLSLRELAVELGYSAMTLSTVRAELESLKFCTHVPKGRSKHLVFSVAGRALWNRAEPYLQNPVTALHWVHLVRPDKRVLQAGLTALAAWTTVSDDELPTYAMKGADYRARLKQGAVVACQGPEDADACVECWRYDPHLLSAGPTVDKLSLYLSLRGMDDERVAKAVKQTLEEMPW